MSPSPVEELALTDLDRSNKGASKQRRDLINAEIAVMRDLLPLSESARQRLSQLQVMSLSCVFIRKGNVLRQLFSSLPAETDMPMMCDFSQALTGFLLITTREGKLVYISENVTDYLGHSMVDMKTQGDSLYDIVDKRDAKSVQAYLTQGGAKDPDMSREVTFFCRMNMSRTLKRQSAFGDVKVMHVKGHFLPLSGPASELQLQKAQQSQQQKYIFMATCTPLITPELKESLIQSNTMVFKTVHRMDMTFMEVTKTAEDHLGCSTEEICKRSWYSMLHQWDVSEARKKHLLLIHASHEVGCMMTVRMLTMEGEILWVNVVMQVRQSASTQSEDRIIVCTNQVISEEEAFQIRMQSHMFALYPPHTGESWNTSMFSHPQPVQADHLSWRQPTSSSSSSSLISPQVPGLANPISSHSLLVQHHQVMPAPNYISGQQVSATDQFTPSLSSSSPTALLSSSTGHTNNLKLMLKRKLQGPCLPSKMPKMAWDMENCQAGQGFENSVAMSDPQPLQLKVIRNKSDGFSWSGSTQSTTFAQHGVARGYAVDINQQQSVRTSMLTPSPSQGSLSPPLSLAVAQKGTEQVVPQAGVMVTVPDSCLTPDSSPASSPDPLTSDSSITVHPKTSQNSDVCETDQKKLSASVQRRMSTSLRSKAAACIKTEPSKGECCQASRRKELPVMDASDIESFFHTLDCDIQFLAVKEQRKEDCQAPLQEISTNLENVPVSKATVLTTQRTIIKQEVDPISHRPLARSQVQQQGMVKKTEEQSEQNYKELEELLSFFSGEMTATQLNLDDLLISALPKGEAEDLEFRQLSDRQEGQICGVGHLNPFLLSRVDEDRPQEGFSPVSPSDSSGDEDGSCCDDPLIKPKATLSSKSVDGKEHGCLPTSFDTFLPILSSPQPSQSVPGIAPSTPEKPGIPEEDELHQLDKLLSLIASNSGMMLSQDSQ